MQTRPYLLTCPGICWVVGVAFGLLVAVLLGTGLVLGLIATVVFGGAAALFLQWAFCQGHSLPHAELEQAHPECVPMAQGFASEDTLAAAPEVKPAPDRAGDVDSKEEAANPDLTKAEVASKPAASAEPLSGAAKPAAKAAKPATKAKTAPKAKAAAPKAAKTAAKPKVAKAVERPVAPDGKPEMLTAARGGKADNLKEIKGVGPKLEALLNRMGVFHFDQIAGWRAPEVAWVDENLEGFKGRVTRDTWVAQAKILAAGGDTEFSKRVDKGEVY